MNANAYVEKHVPVHDCTCTCRCTVHVHFHVDVQYMYISMYTCTYIEHLDFTSFLMLCQASLLVPCTQWRTESGVTSVYVIFTD